MELHWVWLMGWDITLPTKVHLIKAMVFPVIIYGCESSTVKKAECRRTDALELWRWKRLLRVPWTARRSNQSILKEISPEYSLKDWCWSWSSKTLTTWFEELTHLKRCWCWERLKAGEEENGMSWLFPSGSQSIGASASASVLQWIFRTDLL